MGFRNPFRFSIDPPTGWISLADYGPDRGTDAPEPRPGRHRRSQRHQGRRQLRLAVLPRRQPAVRDVDYTTPGVVGAKFNCAAPVNDSPQQHRPDRTAAVVAPPTCGTATSASPIPGISAGGGSAPMGGPVYNYDAEPVRHEVPGLLRRQATSSTSGPQQDVLDPLPTARPAAATPSRRSTRSCRRTVPQADGHGFGPDGSLYVLEWGGGFGRRQQQLRPAPHRLRPRSPFADRQGHDRRRVGPAPLDGGVLGAGVDRPRGAALTYAWDFDGDGTADASTATATHTFETEGVFDARLTVTDPDGKTATTTVPITVGNTRPSSRSPFRRTASFFDFGDDLSWDVAVTDPEDGTVNGDDVIIQPALGHDEHAHPTTPLSGFTGTHGDDPRRARCRRGHLLRDRRPVHGRRRRGRRQPAHRIARRRSSSRSGSRRSSSTARTP